MTDALNLFPSSTSSPASADSRSLLSPSWKTPHGMNNETGQQGGEFVKQVYAEARSAPSDSARSTLTLPPPSPTDGPMCLTLEPFNNSPEIVYLREQVSRRLTALVSSLQGDFPVRDIPLPANEKVPRTNATSGLSASDCFGIYDPASRCSRTSSAFLALTTDFFSTPYLATWPRCGTLANGKLFQQPMLARPTDESESGCSALMNWPSARASDGHKATRTEAGAVREVSRNKGPDLAAVVQTVELGQRSPDSGQPDQDSNSSDGSRRESWATPTADDAEKRGQISADQRNGLPGIVENLPSWPTSTARDYKGVSGSGRQERKGHPTDTLANAIAAEPKDWPTPTAAEGTKIGSQPNYGQIGLSNHPAIQGEPTRAKGEKSRSGPPSPTTGPLDPANDSTTGSGRESWATPEVSNGTGPWEGREGGVNLQTQSAGKLNPSWVETLMGYPIGWTQLPAKFVKPKPPRRTIP
jgi:hypothetical protein